MAFYAEGGEMLAQVAHRGGIKFIPGNIVHQWKYSLTVSPVSLGSGGARVLS